MSFREFIPILNVKAKNQSQDSSDFKVSALNSKLKTPRQKKGNYLW